MNIEVLTGPPGCGKSTVMRRDSIKNPACYVFAYPTIQLLREQAGHFSLEAPSVFLVEAHSGAPGKGTVQKRLEDAVSKIVQDNISHAVVLITHESLMDADFSAFGGWHARIDEAPNAIKSGTLRIPASMDLLKSAMDLQPIGSGDWSEVRLKDTNKSWRDLENDDLYSSIKELLKYARRGNGAYMDSTTWKNSMGWCSVWLPFNLEAFASVKIAGATYLDSLGALILQRKMNAEVSFTKTVIPMHRTAQPTVKIHYFTQHEGNTKLWGERKGRGLIVKLCDFLAQHEPNLGFWAANDEVEKLLDWRVNGEPIRPKAAGMNIWGTETSCAFVYSSKPMPTDGPMKALFDISNDEILRAREEEDILQFAMRGAIRNPDFGNDYDIYLYSKKQAERLQDKLTASQVGIVSLVAEISAGFMDYDPSPMKPIRKAITASKKKERAARDAQRKRKERANAALAAGRQPSANSGKGGRPPKTP